MAKLNLNFSKLFPDNDLCNNGKWFLLGNGIKLLLASGSNYNLKHKSQALKHSLLIDKTFNKKLIDKETVYTEEELLKLEKFSVDMIIKAVLKDWHGVKDQNGKAFEFNEQNAVLVLNQYPELVTIINDLAGDEKNFFKSSDIKKK